MEFLVILGSSCQCTSRKKGVRLLLEIFNPDDHEKQTIDSYTVCPELRGFTRVSLGASIAQSKSKLSATMAHTFEGRRSGSLQQTSNLNQAKKFSTGERNLEMVKEGDDEYQLQSQGQLQQ